MRRILLSLVLGVLCVPAFAQSGLIISEYVEGSSNNKAIELFNGTGSSINIGNYRLQMFFNGSTSVGTSVSMAGQVAPGATYVIVQNSAVQTLRDKANLFSTASWYNGDDAVVLRRVDTNEVIDSIGQIGFDPGNEWGTGLVSTADNTLRRKSSVGTGDTNPFDAFDPSVEWDGFAVDTFGGIGEHNSSAPPPPPPVAVREIYQIQGSGAASPLVGQTVKTLDNTVTAVGPDGFFIQTPDFRADASTSTSNGIFVFTGSAPAVAVGDQVDVTATVAEFFQMTELNNPTTTVDFHGAPLPAYISLAPGFSNFEPLEGMLVRVVAGTAAAGTDRFASTMVVAASSRPFRAPGVSGGDHPEIFELDPTQLGGAAQQIIGGASIELAEGPLSFDFGDYVIWTTALQYTNPTLPRAVRARNAGELTVAAQNMFRLFDDRNDPSIGEPVTDPAVYAARLAKISDHVRNVLGSPDVLAVSEVENIVTLDDLAARINADESDLNYTSYLLEGHDIGGIDVGFLVRDTVAVDSVEQIGADDTWIAPGSSEPETLNDRPPLLLRGAYTANGAAFPIGVIAVHQRSLIDVETSARVRAKRQEQATRLANAIAAMDPSIRLVVTGDFNAFEFNDGFVDVMGILTANLTNQVLSVPANDRYSYVEEGVAQVLDHSLTSAALNPYVRGLQFARSNADAPESSGRASDHDGLALFVMSDHDGDGRADDNDSCPTGDARPTVILDGCDSGAPNLAFEGGCTLADQIAALHASSKNHGQFVAAVGKLLNDLKKSGQLTGEQKGTIESCAARWN